MSHTAPLPKAEARVMARSLPDGDWFPSLEFDPIMLPVEDYAGGIAPVTTDVFNADVMKISDAIVEADAGFSEHKTSAMLEYDLVWSETNRSVKGVCPVCDDVFCIAEGAPGDELNEGYDAVFCGCDPADQRNDENVL